LQERFPNFQDNHNPAFHAQQYQQQNIAKEIVKPMFLLDFLTFVSKPNSQ
jgi:hypothetical protein